MKQFLYEIKKNITEGSDCTKDKTKMLVRDNPRSPEDPNLKFIQAKAHLMCIEFVMLNVKSIKNNLTIETELHASIASIEMFLDKAKDLLKDKNLSKFHPPPKKP